MESFVRYVLETAALDVHRHYFIMLHAVLPVGMLTSVRHPQAIAVQMPADASQLNPPVSPIGQWFTDSYQGRGAKDIAR